MPSIEAIRYISKSDQKKIARISFEDVLSARANCDCKFKTEEIYIYRNIRQELQIHYGRNCNCEEKYVEGFIGNIKNIKYNPQTKKYSYITKCQGCKEKELRATGRVLGDVEIYFGNDIWNCHTKTENCMWKGRNIY